MNYNNYRFKFEIKFNYNVSSIQTESIKYNCRYQGASLFGSSARRRKQMGRLGSNYDISLLSLNYLINRIYLVYIIILKDYF